MQHRTKIIFGIALALLIVVFNLRIVKELFGEGYEIYNSDGAITEYIVETAYQQLKGGHNPFTRTYQILYPFGVNFSLNDPGIGVLPYYAIYRQLVDVHRAMILVLLTNMLLTGSLMWIFLREQKVSPRAAGLSSLVFTFTPFVSQRMLGHYTYITMFVFPLAALALSKVMKTKGKWQNIWAAGLGLVMAWTLYLNFYYFTMITLGLGTVILFHWRWSNLKSWLIAGIAALIMLIPWMSGIWQYIKYENRMQTEGFGGAVYYSAEIKNFFLPSAYNPAYRWLFRRVGGHIEQTYLKNWERLTYPGILVLLALGYYLWRARKIKPGLNKQLRPWILSSLAFALLAMGPFLKWRGSIELLNLEGIPIYLPLPFLALQYIPGLDSLRVPTRFTPALVFLAVVAGAYLLDHVLAKNKRRNLILVLLGIIFLLDQWYQIPPSISPPLPTTLYQQIAKDQEFSTVLEIPFTVRDGFRYAGFVHAIGPMQGSIIHHKASLGGYLARVSEEVMEYYRQLKLGGYLLSITDRGNYNPEYELPAPPKLSPYPFTIEETNQEMDFLQVKYVLIKQDEPYTQLATEVITKAGARLTARAQGYALYERDWQKPIIKIIEYGEDKNDYLYAGAGTVAKKDYRTMVARETKLLFSGKEGLVDLSIILSSEKSRKVEWRLNEKQGGELAVKGKNTYNLKQVSLKDGINILFIRISNLDEGEALDAQSGLMIYSLSVINP